MPEDRPAFQVVESLRATREGASGLLRPERSGVPQGTIAPALLDAGFHILPMYEASSLWPDATVGLVAVPYRIDSLRRYRPLTPDASVVRGESRCRTFAHPLGSITIQLVSDDQVVSEGESTLRLTGSMLAGTRPLDRRAFVGQRQYVPGLGLSQFDGQRTHVASATIAQWDTLPGSTVYLYGPPRGEGVDLVAEVAVRDHVARQAECHPSAVATALERDSATAEAPTRSGQHFVLRLERRSGHVTVYDAPAG